MNDVSEALVPLEPLHRKALEWFWERRGSLIPWPEPLDGHLFLVNKAKGIHKPAGWRHALSVRQTLNGPYADRPPIKRPDGSWSYDYFQEGSLPADRDRAPSNRGLMACSDDSVPVAVLQQVKGKPGVLYEVLGLARVNGWSDGYFHLEGYSGDGRTARADAVVSDVHRLNLLAPPMSLDDARRRIEASIVLRQGGGTFRQLVLKGFGGRCAISDCDVAEGLEAAHIVPYLGAHTNRLENALLLRADLHTLFDRDLLSIDPASLTVVLSKALRGTSYRALSGVSIRLPAGVSVSAMRGSLERREKALSRKSAIVA